MPIVLKLNGTEHVVKALTELSATRRGQGLTTQKALETIGDLVVRSVQRGIRNQVSPDGTAYRPVNRYGEGGKRLMDTNRLLRSITREVSGDRVMVGTNVEYAAMQHHGGVQRPRRAQALAIPLTRQVARAVAAAGGFRAAFPDAFVFRYSGGAFLVRKRQGETIPGTQRQRGVSARRSLEFLAILKKSQPIEGTHFLGLSKEGERDILNYMQRVVSRIVEAK
jgi:phage virion morphogenesis protein